MPKKFFIVAAVMLLITATSFRALKQYFTGRINIELEELIYDLSEMAEVTYDDVSLRFIGLDVIIDDATIVFTSGHTVSVDRVVIYRIDKKQRIPGYLHLCAYGVRFAVDEKNFGPWHSDIKQLGYDTVKADVTCDYTYNKAEELLLVHSCRIMLWEMGYMEARFAVNGVDIEQLAAGKLEDTTIEQAEIHYEDWSLLKRLVSWTTQKDKNFIDFIIETIHEEIKRAKRGSLYSDVRCLDELAGFFTRPEQLAVDIVLRDPVSLETIIGMKKISQLFRLCAFHVSTATVGNEMP